MRTFQVGTGQFGSIQMRSGWDRSNRVMVGRVKLGDSKVGNLLAPQKFFLTQNFCELKKFRTQNFSETEFF